MKKRFGKYVVLVLAGTVVCTATFFALFVSDVFGKFTPAAPYVTGAPDSMENVVYTDEGSNLKGEPGAGVEPCCSEVPPAAKDALKGTKDNPFVILEIVPDHAQQQLVYLNQDEGSEGPLDVLKIGIDTIAKNKPKWNYCDNASSYSDIGLDKNDVFGDAFFSYNYDVYKVGSGKQTENVKLIEMAKLYEIRRTESQMEQMGYKDIDSDYEAYAKLTQDGELLEKYERAGKIVAKCDFTDKKDDSGRKIRDIAVADGRNWKIKREEKSTGKNHYVVKVTKDDFELNQWSNMEEIIKQHPTYFEKDSSGNTISKKARKDYTNWKFKGSESVSYRIETDKISNKDYNDYKNKINVLAEKYPNVFDKDKDGKTIDKDSLKSPRWSADRQEKEQLSEVKTGYFRYVGSGGKYNLNGSWSQELGNYSRMEESSNGEWDYVENLPGGAVEGTSQEDWNRKWWDMSTFSKFYWSAETYKKFNGTPAARVNKEVSYVFSYNNEIYTVEYDGDELDYTYVFKYYGLKTNNILKRSLFVYEDEDDYKDFHVKVITMTPSEINRIGKIDEEMEKKAQEEAERQSQILGKPVEAEKYLDMIERADMFYLGAYDEKTVGIKQVQKIYYRDVLGQDKSQYESKIDKVKSALDDDLDWKLAYKLLCRMCENDRLPMIMTKGVGVLLDNSTIKTPMYTYTTPQVKPPATPAPGTQLVRKEANITSTLSNLVKIYIVASQFDLTANREEDPKYKYTFYNDVLKGGADSNKLQTIALTEASISKESDESATDTGYYQRRELPASGDTGCYYLWNMLTFFPRDMEYAFNDSSGGGIISQGKDVISDFVAHGYLETFFSRDSAPEKVFVENAGYINGGDGKTGNVAIIKGSNDDPHYSTIFGNIDMGSNDSSHVNNGLSAAFTIMNKQAETIRNQIVEVQKQKKEYIKLSATNVMVDRLAGKKYAAKYGDDEAYIKVSLSQNKNNQPGLVTKITLVDEDGKEAPEKADLKLYTTKECKDECEKKTYKDGKNENIVNTGYNISGTMYAYIPYSLKQWANGYKFIEVKTVGRIYSSEDEYFKVGKVVPTLISIDERPLFDLE